jgi:hypothetical protein
MLLCGFKVAMGMNDYVLNLNNQAYELAPEHKFIFIRRQIFSEIPNILTYQGILDYNLAEDIEKISN